MLPSTFEAEPKLRGEPSGKREELADGGTRLLDLSNRTRTFDLKCPDSDIRVKGVFVHPPP